MKPGGRQGNKKAELRKHIQAGLLIVSLSALAVIVQRAVLWFIDGQFYLLGDGLNLWTGAHMALTGQIAKVFDPGAYTTWFQVHYGGDMHVWSYPPSFLLVALPFGLLSPAVGLVCYDLLGFAALLAALRASGVGWRLMAAVLFCPAALTNVSGHQNGALFAAFMIGGLFLAEARPYLAGILIGLLTMKPQLGLLVPIFWLACGNWRGILAAMLTAALLVLVSAWAFTWASWVSFVTKVMPFMAHLLVQLTAKEHGGPRAMIMSVFSLVQQLGLGFHAANAIQLIATIIAVLLAWVLGRAHALPMRFRLAAVLLLSSLATPYVWCYDMIPASLAAALLGQEGMETGFRSGELAVLACLWATPGIALQAAQFGLPSFAPVCVVLALLYLLARMPIRSFAGQPA